MNKILIVLILCLIAANILTFVYGRVKVKKIQGKNVDSEDMYKASSKYIIISIILSFITIAVLTIIAITKLIL